jgi:hypothetical protein
LRDSTRWSRDLDTSLGIPSLVLESLGRQRRLSQQLRGLAQLQKFGFRLPMKVREVVEYHLGALIDYVPQQRKIGARLLPSAKIALYKRNAGSLSLRLAPLENNLGQHQHP